VGGRYWTNFSWKTYFEPREKKEGKTGYSRNSKKLKFPGEERNTGGGPMGKPDSYSYEKKVKRKVSGGTFSRGPVKAGKLLDQVKKRGRRDERGPQRCFGRRGRGTS